MDARPGQQPDNVCPQTQLQSAGMDHRQADEVMDSYKGSIEGTALVEVAWFGAFSSPVNDTVVMPEL